MGGLALALLFGKAMVGPIFAQTAWTNVTFIGSEVRDPGRNLARALLAGCGLVVVLYVLANLAYVAVLPLEGIQQAPQNRVAVAAMNSIFGKPGALAMAAAILISTFGCNNGLILAGARVYYAMARDRLFFRRIGTINARSVPAAALVVQGIWAALLTLPRTVTTNPATGAISYGNVYTQLLEYIVSADLVFYMLLAVAVIVLRKKASRGGAPLPNLGLSHRPDRVGRSLGLSDYRSRLPRAHDIGNRLPAGLERNPSLFRLAPRLLGRSQRLSGRLESNRVREAARRSLALPTEILAQLRKTSST